MRLAIISDVHANLEALQATLQEISGQNVDRIVFLGDVVGYNADPADCVALIREGDALCVSGNHDRASANACRAASPRPRRPARSPGAL